MDKYRMSAPAPKKLTKKLYKIIKEGCQTFFPNSRSRKWIFLLSLPGGKPQPAHRDFLTVSNKIDLYDFSSLPASVIIGLQDDSFIYGYGWNRQVALESEKEKIEFGEVDVLIFHGDFIHGGGDYTTRNVRVHVFLVPANTLQKKIRKSNSITLPPDTKFVFRQNNALRNLKAAGMGAVVSTSTSSGDSYTSATDSANQQSSTTANTPSTETTTTSSDTTTASSPSTSTASTGATTGTWGVSGTDTTTCQQTTGTWHP
ncbi:hypothetical protein PF007_g299 [Phytophthora fragariae]|uniref:Uncharacterized protein n=1 Tax=Phytophthora fragariae TaxID=53985 RepID=A0A6A3TQ27_9STRA|nr:hypothetical protein PF007_g299 [Phytophthora fragariae]